MFQFRTHRRRISPGMAGLAMATALAATGCLAVAGPSSATELFLVSDALTDPGLVIVKGDGVEASIYASPLELEMADASGPGGWMGELIGFFMNMFDFLTAGWSGQPSSFQAGGGGGGGGVGLSRSQSQKIGGLVNYGAQIVHLHAIDPSKAGGDVAAPVGDGDLSDQLAGLQGAIWQIENPAYVVTGGTDAIQADLSQDLSLAGDLRGSFQIIPLDGDPDQTLAVPSDVPEPGAWALMLLGALGLGSSLRRARTIKGKTPMPA